jgi:hypothetical protein
VIALILLGEVSLIIKATRSAAFVGPPLVDVVGRTVDSGAASGRLSLQLCRKGEGTAGVAVGEKERGRPLVVGPVVGPLGVLGTVIDTRGGFKVVCARGGDSARVRICGGVVDVDASDRVEAVRVDVTGTGGGGINFVESSPSMRLRFASGRGRSGSLR